MGGPNLQPGKLLRASKEQWARWLKAAKQAGLSFSEWARRVLDEAARKP
jgi:hypothetical protein